MDNFQDKWNSKQKSDSSHSDVLPLSVSSSMMTATNFLLKRTETEKENAQHTQLIALYAL